MNAEYLNQLVANCRSESICGAVAKYIPQLATANPEDLGICIRNADGLFCAGDAHTKFTIQSVSKPLVLLLALMDNGPQRVFDKVGKEPSGDPFNSIIRLETYKKQKPYNPMINAGAIAISALIHGATVEERIQRVLAFTRRLAHNPNVTINTDVFLSEKETGHRNRSIAYFLKEIGNLEGDPLEVLDLYFNQCAIEMTCEDLANISMVLALDGKSYETGEQLVPREYTRIAKAYMMTSGMYDGSGEFAIEVGLPAKSGVGGGIMATSLGKLGIGIYGPSLNQKGNPVAGLKLLKTLSDDFDLRIL
jgi:glutaminase